MLTLDWRSQCKVLRAPSLVLYVLALLLSHLNLHTLGQQVVPRMLLLLLCIIHTHTRHQIPCHSGRRAPLVVCLHCLNTMADCLISQLDSNGWWWWPGIPLIPIRCDEQEVGDTSLWGWWGELVSIGDEKEAKMWASMNGSIRLMGAHTHWFRLQTVRLGFACRPRGTSRFFSLTAA